MTFEMIQAEYETERGKPMPSRNHSILQIRLGFLLEKKYGDRYTAMSEVSLKLPSLRSTPDISVYPKFAAIDWTEDELQMTEPPLLIIEIVSASQSDYEMVQRLKTYFKDGVKSCWLVQPALGFITVFKSDMTRQIFSAGDVQDSEIGVTIALSEIF